MPRALGNYTFRMLVEGSGGGGTYVASQTITLTGAGTSPVPMDNVLVLDRSGSMIEFAGTRKKIEALQKAAMLYHDLLREDGGDGNGDRLGMAKYNHNNSVYHPLDYKNATNIPIVLDELSDAAISDVSRLGPDGTTSIGGALQRGAGMLVSSPASRKQIMVVMTDGKENTPPYIGDVLGSILADNTDLMIYSIGLGNSIDPARLQSITNVGNGYHQVSEDLLGLNHFALEEFYFKIYANASGADLIVDPTEAVDLSDGAPKIVQRATIVSSDRYAIFMVLDDPILSTLYTLEFVDPHGNILDPSSSIGGIPIQVMKRSGYAVYKIIFPDISQGEFVYGRLDIAFESK